MVLRNDSRIIQNSNRGRQESSDGGLNLPVKGLKYGFQGTVNVKIIRKNIFSLSDGG